jgi:uncharacterized protein (DUF305 family)
MKENFMPMRFSLVCAALLFASTAGVFGQTPAQPGNSVPLIQPGAPGKPDKVLTEATTAGTGQQGPTEADVKFMQGMIMHHNQAVEMVALMAGRTKNAKLLEFGQRISISQTDEMKFMKRWLTYRDKPVMDMGDMAGMAHMDMSHMDMPLMPGMLTPQQMEALRKASGPKFDQLFLTGMIQHHTGALTMLDDLFATPGAAQDMQLFDFTADIGVTQQGEIDAMRNMLAKEK